MKKYFRDVRGEIRKFDINGTKFNLITTKAGAFRSGDVHKSAQYDLILEGKFKITMRKKNRNVVVKKGKNNLVIIPPKTPHLFEALKDSVMIEWWSGPFEATYYKPYRRIVEASIEMAKRKAGKKRK